MTNKIKATSMIKVANLKYLLRVEKIIKEIIWEIVLLSKKVLVKTISNLLTEYFISSYSFFGDYSFLNLKLQQIQIVAAICNFFTFDTVLDPRSSDCNVRGQQA